MNVLHYAAAAGLTALIVYLMIVGNAILLPLVIAIFVCYLINALAAVTRDMRIFGTPLPNSLRLTAAIVVFLLVSWFVVSLVVRNINQVTAAVPVYQQNLRLKAERLGQRFGATYPTYLQPLFTNVDLGSMARSLARTVAGTIGTTGTVAVYVVFLLVEQHSLDKKIAALCPGPAREALMHRILQRIGNQIQTYVWLKTVMSVVVGIGSYLVMKIVGVDFAEFWALLIFALNYIPYLGSLFGVIFPSVLALVQFPTLTPSLVMAGVLTVLQFTCGSIIEPRLMGKGLNLSPVVMLLALSVWGTIWGIVGMFLAVPLMVVAMIVCSHFESTRGLAVLMSADGEIRS
jgi:predicted PurR-regulated permease PerM